MSAPDLPYVRPVDYPPFGTMTPRDTASITDLVIHHTAGPVTQTPLDIDAEHRRIGDACIAYNFVVAHDGKVYHGRPIPFVPAATYGRNAQSIAVALVGNFQPNDAGYTGPPTSAQIASLTRLCIDLHRAYPHIERTYSHRDVAALFYNGDSNYATACPGSDLYRLLPTIKASIASALNVH